MSLTLDEIRAAMPVTQNKIYLNTGTSGPLSIRTVETLTHETTFELAEGRANMTGFELLFAAKTTVRQAFADLTGATPAEIALTHHTTDGMNIALHGITWQPGDDVVTTTLEHEGGLFPLYVLRQRQGINLHIVELTETDSPAAIVAKLESAITPRTRALVFSHVAWNTGQRLPLAEISAMAQQQHVLTVVDAAQSAGAIALDLPASGVDFYAMTGQKWLCGPEGIGALYVNRRRLSLLSPTFVGYSSADSGYDLSGYFMPAQGARRFEVGTVYRPGVKAMAANLTWLAQTIGWDFIYRRIESLFTYTRAALAEVPGITVITPPGPQAGLITFNLTGYDPARVVKKLGQQAIVIRYLPQPYALRVSTGFYNTEDDINRLITALKDILATDPNNLPAM